MTDRSKSITILMADDDADDRMMTREAFERLVDVIRTLGRYWLEIVELPGDETEV
jgi:hypothetical protein